MKRIFAYEKLSCEVPSIYLAGPNQRNRNGVGWYRQAVQILDEKNFAGEVVIPTLRNKESVDDCIRKEKKKFLDWKKEMLQDVEVIACWIPKGTQHVGNDLLILGNYMDSGKLIYGDAIENLDMSEIDYWLASSGIQVRDSLEHTIHASMRVAQRRYNEIASMRSFNQSRSA